MLNSEVCKKIQLHKKKILIVTKYWDQEITLQIQKEAKENYPDIYFGIWENRTNILQEKNLPRENTHFIGNIQSREIKNITRLCSTIHSLSSIKHAKKIENQNVKIQAFIQIKLDETKNIWISEEELSEFILACKDFKNLKIIWISGMWAADIQESEKREEFRKLIHIRDQYMPQWLISAGTSRDYQIALEEWIDVVRVGSKAIVKK